MHRPLERDRHRYQTEQPWILPVGSPAILAVHSNGTELYRILDTLTHISSDRQHFI